MSEFFGHHELRSRHRFAGELELLTPLRLSSGRSSPETDAPLMRTRDGVPYIPGSSLRGALRSEVERIVSGAGEAAGLTSCVLFSGADDGGEGGCLTAAGRERQEELQRRFQEMDDKQVLAALEDGLCHVCRLFGSPLFASRLVIEDGYPVNGGRLDGETTVRDGVGIDRDTGTARENVKFDFEVLEPGPRFTFRMQAENLGASDRQLVNLALGLLRQGLFTGGKRAAGLGKVRLAAAPEVTGFEDPQTLWRALSRGEDPHRRLTWEGGAGC